MSDERLKKLYATAQAAWPKNFSGGAMPSPWVTYSPLLPLALLMLTGLYMFVLPYLQKTSVARPAGE